MNKNESELFILWILLNTFATDCSNAPNKWCGEVWFQIKATLQVESNENEDSIRCSVKTSHCVIFRGHFSSRQNCTQFIIGKLTFQARLLGTTNDHSGGSAGSMSMTGSNAGDGTSNSSSSSSSSMMSTSSKCLSKFSSPFKRNKKNKAKNSATSSLATASSSSSDQENAKVADFEQLLLAPDNSHREEMLRLFILKLDEEANYFQVSASPEEELCDCQKCQVTHSLFGLTSLRFMALASQVRYWNTNTIPHPKRAPNTLMFLVHFIITVHLVHSEQK